VLRLVEHARREQLAVVDVDRPGQGAHGDQVDAGRLPVELEEGARQVEPATRCPGQPVLVSGHGADSTTSARHQGGQAPAWVAATERFESPSSKRSRVGQP
jgi:hypothetical protein